jgi:hypothetical protein
MALTNSDRVSVAPTEGSPQAGLLPWRMVVTPHPDVASGKYQQAEFAADLAQVARGEGGDEYRDPREFFRRTYPTDGLQRLLKGTILRLSGIGGDPIVELQTNFGGGKTHSMLALYHLVSGMKAAELLGVEPLLKESGAAALPEARRAVLVGTALSPGQPSTKDDGTVVRTLWGELAWQLGRKEGYALVAGADATGTNPGDALDALFKRYAPCLVLIDEWVAYARQLFGKDDLPGGSFDTHFSFAQALTESARRVGRVQVVLSIPASDERTDARGKKYIVSDIEIGGEGGRAALDRLKNVIGRTQSSWRPATAEESFEIVRRRLFQPIADPELFKARDAVIRAFVEMYRAGPQDFPIECQAAEYRTKLEAAYPIHPELFDRLYTDWGSLERFQRTRGVLRLMAAVIHELWERSDAGLSILPAMVPIDAGPVADELTRYLEDNWRPVLERDVDGATSVSLALDRENPNLNRYSACRRAARTVYLGSAPNLKASIHGIDDRRIRLGCVQPGESAPIFGDALRRLSDRANHLYVDGSRYWFSPQPSVTRLAEERAVQQTEDDVALEIVRRIRLDARTRAEFAGVHAAVPSGDVPDDREVRLVVLGPAYPHTAKSADSPARQQSKDVFEYRGSAPRTFKNAVVFLGPDAARLRELEAATRQYLAWKSIVEEHKELELGPFQVNQAKTKLDHADKTVIGRIPETWCWLLVPAQAKEPGSPVTWSESRLQAGDALAVRATKKLKNDGLLLTQMAGTNLRLDLDTIPLWQGDHVGVKRLADCYATYLYLPRLKRPEVLLDAVSSGVALLSWAQDTFACADRWDEKAGRYRGLRTAKNPPGQVSEEMLVVKAEVATRQLEEATLPPVAIAGLGGVVPPGTRTYPTPPPPSPAQVSDLRPGPPRRFHGSVELDATRAGRDASRIADEVIAHLQALLGAEVKVTLQIEAVVPIGVPDHTKRTVMENCRTLRFNSSEFDDETRVQNE